MVPVSACVPVLVCGCWPPFGSVPPRPQSAFSVTLSFPLRPPYAPLRTFNSPSLFFLISGGGGGAGEPFRFAFSCASALAFLCGNVSVSVHISITAIRARQAYLSFCTPSVLLTQRAPPALKTPASKQGMHASEAASIYMRACTLMCFCMYLHVYACAYAPAHVYVNPCICEHAYVHVCMYAYTCVYAHSGSCVCVCVSVLPGLSASSVCVSRSAHMLTRTTRASLPLCLFVSVFFHKPPSFRFSL